MNAALFLQYMVNLSKTNQRVLNMKSMKAFFVISLAFIVIACGGAEERKAAYMEKAEQSLNAGDLDKARIELKEVLQIDPRDAGAWFRLGNILERKKEFNKALGNYSKAAELDPENNAYQAKLGRFYLIVGSDIEKATEKMNLILGRDKTDSDGLLLKAAILLKQNNAADAKEICRNIFENHPDHVKNAVFLSSLYSHDKEYTEAITVLDTALKSNPDNQSLLSVLGNTLYLNNNYERSEQVWQKILDAHPETFQNHLMLALFYQRTNQTEKAEQVLRAAIAADEKDAERKLALIDFLQHNASKDQAIIELKTIIEKNRSEGVYRLVLARLQLSNEDTDGAIATYKAAIEDFSENETGITSRAQLATIYMTEDEIERATSIIDEAAEIAPSDSEVNLVKAKIALYQNDIEQGIISLRSVIKEDPANIQAYFLLARSHRAKHETRQAEDVIARAYENNRDNIGALMPLAKYHIQNKNTADAEKIIDDYLRLDANNYEALSIKSSILNARRDFKPAYQLAEKLVNLYPEKENGYVQSVPALVSQREIDKAIDLLRTGYEKTGSLQVLRVSAVVLVSAGRAADAVALLQSVSEKDDSEQVLLLLADAHLANKDNEAAIEVLRDSVTQDKTRAESYIALASIYSNNKDNEQTLAVLEDSVRANPDNTKLAITLAGYYEKMGNIDDAIKHYEHILADKPENLIANNNLASLLSDHRTDEASLKRAKEIADVLKYVNQPVVLDTVGWVYFKTGNLIDAIAVLEKVVAAEPNTPKFSYHLGMAHHRAGNSDEARKFLEAALSSDKEFNGRDVAESTLNSL
jgi:tetratricopeptide (TPR) repeat protein